VNARATGPSETRGGAPALLADLPALRSDVPALLAGKRALVTGGAGGIGSALVAGFLAAGATVAVVGRSESVHEVAARTVAEVSGDRRSGNTEPGERQVFGLVADLASRAELDRSFAEAVARLGGLDVLLTSHSHVKPLESSAVELADWDLTIETNITSVFRLSQLAFEVMRPQGAGKIIHIASMYAFFGGLRVAAYAASKGAVAQLTKSLALEWAPLGINVNAIAPGYVRTGLNRHVWGDPERAGQVLSRIPAGRWGEPGDIVGPALFLASQLSDYVHGVVLPADGGYLAR
jgi:2-deoxy-D-gluconate 3-dehydrogenase